MADKCWDRQDRAHRAEFSRFMAPLVAASRTKNFTEAEALAYLLSLADVPRDVLGEAVTRMLESGVTWMPRAGDIRSACCDVIDQRRQVAARQAKALAEDCQECEGTQWKRLEGVDGFERVTRCRCFTRGLELVTQAGAALKRPALPESTETADVG